MKNLILLAAILMASASAFANGSFDGKWKGHVVIMTPDNKRLSCTEQFEFTRRPVTPPAISGSGSHDCGEVTGENVFNADIIGKDLFDKGEKRGSITENQIEFTVINESIQMKEEYLLILMNEELYYKVTTTFLSQKYPQVMSGVLVRDSK